MKRIIALNLVLAFLCAASAPATAQRNQDIRTSRTKAADADSRFGSVRAYSDGSGVLVEWEMAVEKKNAGFVVIRIDGGNSTVITPEMILSSAPTFAVGQRYNYFDPAGTEGSAYFIQNIGADGRSGISATVPVEWVADLEQLGHGSSIELNRLAATSKEKGRILQERLSLPKTLASEIRMNRLAADDATHAWVVSQPGVRIGVRREGFYRVAKTDLQAAGFNVNGDSNLWQLYREGVEQAIIVGPNADYIEFYGKGVDTPETDAAVYFLVSGPAAGKRIQTRVARPYSGTVTSSNYSQVFVQKQRMSYLSQLLNGDAENYFGSGIGIFGDTTVNFTLTGVDFNVPEVSMEVKFLGYSLSQHDILVTLNGNSLPSATASGRVAFSKQYTIPTSHLREGANSIVFRAAGPTAESTFFDTISIAFPRKHLASQNQLKFYTANYRLSKL